ncbi:MAG: undecaprenyl/decaprenyl-phosphate alpha-N-acetylglucosaminyl 1-phosphate transferase [Bacteroidetes bacterium]|nr:undecaprenyl/decaprenyl-phosphate alpha-N-acetylglucosaminyl 1-phosphate transferase [Bacteroidota bacterium]MBK9048264.1 undecaprenyl/decaprenyl-phosphate alpha-N-acetylglucosaminyl 1-phosphate transferase [Bacteroidota bacterium]MBK9425374.1 undecaprenyl/decaprenyl-phosphate alpha-N-acetylglucosaminyl 1-phosphate transferase [Bacteroidota bacterium]MBL0072200.1 undecaprenyl/decaprenyl-phosphate alpha-N-acetylglucosaminyl 1-phosphate transferase [Bacteroidota bacterium]
MDQLLQEHYHLVIYSVFFVSSVIFSFLMNNLFLRFFKTLGIRNNNDGTIIRWGALSKPAVGGISFYILFLLSVACYSVFFSPSQVFYNTKFIGLLLSMALGFIVGLADDAYDTKPFLKFFVQFSCGAIMIATGIRIEIFEWEALNILFTLFWVVGIMNSINMLDNMDGITTTVSIGIVICAMIIILTNADFENMHLIILVGVLSSLLTFLWFNWNPSRMYMGDTGSQFLGAFLAAIGIMYFWNDHYVGAIISPARQFIIAIMCFILPVIDTTVVVYNRVSNGKSPFVGGKDHTTHSLAYLGLSDRQVALCFMGLSIISTICIFVIENYITEWSHLYTAIFGIYFLSLLVFFFNATRKAAQKRGQSDKKVAGIT